MADAGDLKSLGAIRTGSSPVFSIMESVDCGGFLFYCGCAFGRFRRVGGACFRGGVCCRAVCKLIGRLKDVCRRCWRGVSDWGGDMPVMPTTARNRIVSLRDLWGRFVWDLGFNACGMLRFYSVRVTVVRCVVVLFGLLRLCHACLFVCSTKRSGLRCPPFLFCAGLAAICGGGSSVPTLAFVSRLSF